MHGSMIAGSIQGSGQIGGGGDYEGLRRVVMCWEGLGRVKQRGALIIPQY